MRRCAASPEIDHLFCPLTLCCVELALRMSGSMSACRAKEGVGGAQPNAKERIFLQPRVSHGCKIAPRHSSRESDDQRVGVELRLTYAKTSIVPRAAGATK